MNVQSSTEPQRERSGLASVVGAALPMASPHPPPGLGALGTLGWKVLPTLTSLTFSRGCAVVCLTVMRLRRLLYLLLSLNTARPVPVVTDLCWENSSDWIWKLFKQSGRLGCLIFMWMLRLLSWWSAGPQGSHLHGSLSRQIWRAQSRASSSRTKGIRTEYLC